MAQKRKEMTNLVVRIETEQKNNLSDAALRLGFSRLEDGEIRGNSSMLVKLLTRALAEKRADEIRAFLGIEKTEQ